MKSMRIQETIGFDFKITEGVAAAARPDRQIKYNLSEARSKNPAADTPVPGGTTDEEGDPTRIITVIEAIHAGLTRNLTFYSAENLEKSARTWTDPYAKPMIVNHDTDEEPLGRVINANFKKSQLSPDASCIELEVEITDPDTIEMVLDGRYLTVSIGGSANSVTCSICGKDLVQEGYCGHMKGKTYEGKQAYWIIGDMQFDEVSFVNVPADGYAQIVEKDIAPENKDGEVPKDDQTQPTKAAKEGVKKMPKQVKLPASVKENADDILDVIDGIRTTEAETAPDEAPEDPEEAPETEEEPADAPEEENPEEAPEEEEDDPEAPGEELRVAKGRIAVLETENTTLLAERDSAQSALTITQQELQTVQENLAAAEVEAKSLREKSITLAAYAHSLLVEGVVNVSMALGQVAESGVDELKGQLVKESSRSLKDKMKTLVVEKSSTPREINHIHNPGLVVRGEQDADGDFNESTKPEDKQELTLDAFAEKVSKALSRRS